MRYEKLIRDVITQDVSLFSETTQHIGLIVRKYSNSKENLTPGILCAALINILYNESLSEDKEESIKLLETHIKTIKGLLENYKKGIPALNQKDCIDILMQKLQDD